jgi:enoyl-CoA hydratase/carnithine racemase
MGAQFVDIEQRDEVQWIYFNNFDKTLAGADAGTVDVHTAIGRAMQAARFDPGVRVVVLTGREDGEFYSVPSAEHYSVQEHRDRVNPLKRPGSFAMHSYPDVIETLAFMEKPVVARVNGDVIGFGQSVLWGCDIIVARDDAVVADVHTGQGDVVDSQGVHRGFPQAISPGDGAMAFFPAFLPPTKLKEYMMLSKAYTTRELAAMNIVNYAVPMADLDAKVGEVVGQLLARPSSVLAHVKRLCSKHLIQQLNLARDLSAAYEVNDLWVHAKEGTM